MVRVTFALYFGILSLFVAVNHELLQTLLTKAVINRLQSSQKKMADTSNFEKSNLESMDLFNFEYE